MQKRMHTVRKFGKWAIILLLVYFIVSVIGYYGFRKRVNVNWGNGHRSLFYYFSDKVRVNKTLYIGYLPWICLSSRGMPVDESQLGPDGP